MLPAWGLMAVQGMKFAPTDHGCAADHRLAFAADQRG